MIDEKKLIEGLEEWRDETYPMESDIVTDVIGFIEEQPKANEWIPCSERLPDVEGCYIVTLTSYDGDHTCISLFNPKNPLDVKFWNEGLDVIAWRPLPEPWEGGQE